MKGAHGQGLKGLSKRDRKIGDALERNFHAGVRQHRDLERLNYAVAGFNKRQEFDGVRRGE